MTVGTYLYLVVDYHWDVNGRWSVKGQSRPSNSKALAQLEATAGAESIITYNGSGCDEC